MLIFSGVNPWWPLNTIRPKPNRSHFADDIFELILMSERCWISIQIPMKCVPNDPIVNNPALDIEWFSADDGLD